MMTIKKKCVNCGLMIKSFSPMRKYCYDCRVDMRKTWAENTKNNKNKK